MMPFTEKDWHVMRGEKLLMAKELDRLRAENAELRHRLIHCLTCELEEHEIAEYRNYLDKTANETKPT
jgi:hypothetical protein